MQRYPMQMPPTASERVLFGLGPGERRTDLSITMPVHTREGDLLGYLELSESPAFGQEIIDDVAGNAILAGGAAVLLAALAGWFASRQISQPVVALAETTRRMAEGDLSVRVSLQRRDEFGTLGRRFNMMAEQVENTVTTLRRFAAGVAHEINTPITACDQSDGRSGASPPDSGRYRARPGRAGIPETLTQGC